VRPIDAARRVTFDAFFAAAWAFSLFRPMVPEPFQSLFRPFFLRNDFILRSLRVPFLEGSGTASTPPFVQSRMRFTCLHLLFRFLSKFDPSPPAFPPLLSSFFSVPPLPGPAPRTKVRWPMSVDVSDGSSLQHPRSRSSAGGLFSRSPEERSCIFVPLFLSPLLRIDISGDSP